MAGRRREHRLVGRAVPACRVAGPHRRRDAKSAQGSLNHAVAVRSSAAAHLPRRGRSPRAQAALRSHRVEGPRDAPGRRHRPARTDGLRPFEPAAHGQDPAPVGGSAGRHRDRRERGQDQRVPAGPRRHDGQRAGDSGEGAGVAVRHQRQTQKLRSMAMIGWAHAGPSVLAAFLASLVEFVEALTVVLAVGATRGWRSALGGTALGLLTLAILVIALGPALARIPLTLVQLMVGTLLLLFGLRWLRKAILRAAGIIPLHDELAAYRAETDLLSHSPRRLLAGWDTVAITTSFKIVMLE